MISVAHNLVAMNAGRQLNIVNDTKAKTAEKLSSGYRINRAADDAAGLAISEKMRRQIRGLVQASANSQEGISLCQVADGALNEVNDMLHRIEELSVKAANGTNTQQDREYIQEEISQIVDEIDRISNNTTFNEMKVFQGGEGSAQRRVQNSLRAGVTDDSVSGGDYRLTATENSGIQIALSTAGGSPSQVASFNWNEVKNAADPSKTLADTTIAAGNYILEKNGISLSFNVAPESTLADVTEALNEAEFSVDKDEVTFYTVVSMGAKVQETAPGANPGAEAFFTNGPYTFHVDEEGIWMTNDAGTVNTTKVTWSSMGVSPDTIGGKTFTYNCPDTGYKLEFGIDANATFDEVLNCLNNRAVNYYEVSNYSWNGTWEDDWKGTVTVEYSKKSYSFSEEFIDDFNLTKVQRQNLSFIVKNSGSSLNDFQLQVYAYGPDGQILSNSTTQYLKAANAETEAFLEKHHFQ